jgi:hypothetical protein
VAGLRGGEELSRGYMECNPSLVGGATSISIDKGGQETDNIPP